MTNDTTILLTSMLLMALTCGFLLYRLLKVKHSTGLYLSKIDNYSSIIDQANDAMLVIDIGDGRILQFNPSATQLLGYTHKELSGMSLFSLHPPEYLGKSSSIVADVWEKSGMIYNDIPFITKNREVIAVECSARVAPFAGRPAIVIYARDIRERLKLERELSEQRRIVDEKNQDIKDSIEYSKRIQRSIFLEKEKLKEYAPDSFILFEPRDIVSGDFYWFNKFVFEEDLQSTSGFEYKKGEELLVIAAVDCTGHGIPGAFMSIIGNNLLNQLFTNKNIKSTGEALDFINAELKNSLNKNSEEDNLRDGMDMALCVIDIKHMRMEFAGANNPVYLIRKGELQVLNTDKHAISAYSEITPKRFTNQVLPLEKGDAIYLFTDGFADQFGGEGLPGIKAGGKKFLNKRFKQALLRISDKPMKQQQQALQEVFLKWKGSLEQVDDVLVIGIRI